MRRLPLAAGLSLLVIVGAPFGIAAAVGAASGSGLWVAVHACARVGAAVASMPALLALGLAASILLLGLGYGARQSLVSARAVRLAARHAVAPPPDVQAAAAELGVRRLLVTDLPGRLTYCAGLLRPAVVLSRASLDVLSPEALRAVLAHEAAHAKGRDPLRQVLAHVAARSLWMAPAGLVVAAHQRRCLELSADRAAVRRVGRRALAAALLALHDPGDAAAAPAVSGGGSLLDERIDALEGAPPARLTVGAGRVVRSLAGLALCALVVALALAGPTAGAEPLVAMPMDGAAIGEMVVSWLVRVVLISGLWAAIRGLVRGPRAPRTCALRRSS